MTEKIVTRVRFEIDQIDQLLESYTDLLELVLVEEPDLVQTTAVASVLHSYYNGLENIFMIIAKGMDGSVPDGPKWHRDLLIQMSESTPERKPVLTKETADQLADYMGFRHFYRHSYSFRLDWNEMESLATSLTASWTQTKRELETYLMDVSSPENQDQSE